MNLLQRLTRGDAKRSMSFSDALGLVMKYGNSGLNFTYSGSEERVGAGFSSRAELGYGANGVVFSCILNRMLVFSEARFQFQGLRGGRPGDLFGTPDLALLERPWQNGTTGELLARMEQDASLAGNAYIVRRPGQLARLRPDWVSIIAGSPNASGDDILNDPDARIVGYCYDPPNGPTEIFPANEVAHYSPIPDPMARFIGMSWLSPVLREIDADSAANRHKLKFFENGATPNMVVTMDAAVAPEKVERFKAIFDESHVGVENAYKTLFLGGGADVNVVGQSFEQMAFKATQGAGETRIAAAAGVPPVIVGLSEGLQAATYSNYSQARRRFADGTIRPLWRIAAASLETIVTPPQGARLWFDDRDIAFLREDTKDEAEINGLNSRTIRTLIDAGYEPDAVVAAVQAGDYSLLTGKHSGLYSVQLQAPGSQDTTPAPAEEEQNNAEPKQLSLRLVRDEHGRVSEVVGA